MKEKHALAKLKPTLLSLGAVLINLEAPNGSSASHQVISYTPGIVASWHIPSEPLP